MPCAGSVCAMQPVVPVFDNLTAALQDKRTARYRLGEDGARLELSKPLGQGLTSTVFSAPWAKSAVVKVVLPNICRKRTSCPYVAFIVMGRAAGVPLAALEQQVDTHLISGIWSALEALRRLWIVHTDLHLGNLFATSNADAVANQTAKWSVSIIDYGAAFANTCQLNRTETLKKGGNNVVPLKTWVRFRQHCITAGQGGICTDTLLGTLGRQDVDQNVVALRKRASLLPDTLGQFKESIVRQVSLQAQAARAGLSPNIYHAWLERNIRIP